MSVYGPYSLEKSIPLKTNLNIALNKASGKSNIWNMRQTVLVLALELLITKMFVPAGK